MLMINTLLALEATSEAAQGLELFGFSPAQIGAIAMLSMMVFGILTGRGIIPKIFLVEAEKKAAERLEEVKNEYAKRIEDSKTEAQRWREAYETERQARQQIQESLTALIFEGAIQIEPEEERGGE